MTVTLQPITAETVRSILRLETREDQRRFVAPVAISISQAYFEPRAEVLAVYAGDMPVGFMQWCDHGDGIAYLWRFLIDKSHQSKGYGRAAIEALCEALRQRGFRRLTLSYVPGPDGPCGFYAGLGFAETGEVDEDENVAARDL